MARIATTNHENAVKNTGKMPALPAFSHKCAFKEVNLVVGRYASGTQLGLPSEAEEVSGRLTAWTARWCVLTYFAVLNQKMLQLVKNLRALTRGGGIMTGEKQEVEDERRGSAGPLRIHEEDGALFVVGFGLWLPVTSPEEGLQLISELEDQGYRLCY